MPPSQNPKTKSNPVIPKPGTINTNGVIHAAPPPPSANSNAPHIDPQNPTSGLAYYDKLRKELRDLIARKKGVDKNLEQLEDHIHKFETSYLEETQNGNIVRGFDNYIKGTVARRRAAISDSDRIFSSSSYSYMKAREEAANNPPPSASAPDTSANTPVATSAGGANTKSNKKGNKKKRKGANDDDSDSPSEVETPGPKRVRISFSGHNGAAEK